MSHKRKNTDGGVSNTGNDRMMEERLSFIICTSHKKFIRMIKPRRMRWVGHMTCMEDK